MGIEPDTGTTPLGRIEITFGAEGQDVISPVSITNELSNLLISAGWNPEEFNKISWPIGASNFGRGRFLLDGKTANAIAETLKVNFSLDEDTQWYRNDGISILFDGLLFDGMHMLAPVPVLIPTTYSEDVQFYACDFVDYRYWWQKHTVGAPFFIPGGERKESRFRYGINMLEESLGPGAFHPETLFGTSETEDTLWNLPRLINFMLGLHDDQEVNGRAEFYYLPKKEAWNYDNNEDSNLYHVNDLIDISASGRPFGEFLDSILTLTGHVLIAYPSRSYTGSLSYRYWISPIANTNTAFSEEFTEQFEGSIISGGMLPSVVHNGTEVVTDPTLDMSPASIAASVPEKLNVYFRNAFFGNAPSEFIEQHPEHNPALSDYEVVQSTDPEINGRPDIYWLGRQHPVYSTISAIKNYENGEMVWTNENQCLNYANWVGRRFYDRFRCDPVDVIMSGTFGNLQDLVLWPGSQEVVWSITGRGPITKISGSYNHPLFGLMPKNDLGSGSVVSTSTTKISHRPDGRLKITTPIIDVRQTVHHAIITGVNQSGPLQRPLYSAVSLTDPIIAVQNVIPMSPHNSAFVDIQPLLVGTHCMIGVIQYPEEEEEEGGAVSSPQAVNPQVPSFNSLQGSVTSAVGFSGSNRYSPTLRTDSSPRTDFGGIDRVANQTVPEEVRKAAEQGIELSGGMFGNIEIHNIFRVNVDGEELDLVLYVWEKPLYSICNNQAGVRSGGFYGSNLSSIGGY